MPLKIQILDCLTDFSKAMKLESLDVTDYEIALIMMKVVTLRTWNPVSCYLRVGGSIRANISTLDVSFSICKMNSGK